MFLSILLLLGLVLNQQSAYADNSYGIYFDNSLSSQTVEGQETAKQLASNLVESKRSPGVYFDNRSKHILNQDFNVKALEGPFTNTSLPFSEIHNKLSSSLVENFYFISDYQAIDKEKLDFLVADTALSYSLFFLKALNDLPNVSIDTLFINPNPNDLSKLSIVVDFNVHNMTEGNIVIKLLRESSQVSSIVKEVSELNQVEFDVSVDNHGAFEIMLSGDQVGFDNSFYFVISKQSKPKIVILEADNIDYVASAFSNEELFEVSTQKVNNVDYEVLKEADLVVFNGVDDLPVGLIRQFTEPNYIIFPSDLSGGSDYAELTRLSFQQSTNDMTEISVEKNHPILRGIFEKSIDESILPELPIAYSISGDFERIINYRNGQPFLFKSGNLFFFNTTLNRINGFQSKALFVPVLYQIAFSSSSKVDFPYHYPGDRFVISDFTLSDDPVKIINSSYELIPAFNYNGNRLTIQMPSDIQIGKYYVVHREDTLRQLAVNVPKAESIMRSPTVEELRTYYSDRKNVAIIEIGSNLNASISDNSKVSLWKYALILALLLVLSETILHRYLK